MLALIKGKLSLHNFRLMVETDRASRILTPIAVAHSSGSIKWRFEYFAPRRETVKDFTLILPSGRSYPKDSGIGPRSAVLMDIGEKCEFNYSIGYHAEHAASKTDAELLEFFREWRKTYDRSGN